MTAHVLTLYVAVHKDDAPSCEASGCLPRRYVGGRPHVGLRENPEDALARASWFETETVSKGTHVLLEWRLSAEGLAQYVTTCAGPEHGFAPVLSKQIYSDGYDWKVWRFLGDLPLRARGVDSEFKEIE